MYSKITALLTILSLFLSVAVLSAGACKWRKITENVVLDYECDEDDINCEGCSSNANGNPAACAWASATFYAGTSTWNVKDDVADNEGLEYDGEEEVDCHTHINCKTILRFQRKCVDGACVLLQKGEPQDNCTQCLEGDDGFLEHKVTLTNLKECDEGGGGNG